MTSGSGSPIPADSPSLSIRPLLVSQEVVRVKKCVGFQNIQIDIECNDEPYVQRLQVAGPDGRVRGDRLLQPRMSLLGKPLNYRATRRDARYRRLQSRIYNFLERPRGVAFFYHIFVFIMVFFGLVLSVFSTIDRYEKQAGDVLVYMESIVVVLFSVELGLRTWSSGCRSRYQGYIGRLKFLRRPFCIIDVITIVASIVVLVLTMKSGGQVVAASALRGLRFFQILRMVRMDRRGGTWKLLGSVVFAHRQELITTLYIGFLGLIFSSFLVFLAEKDEPDTKFSNFAQALWWGVITLCTVGYGDMVPCTWQGKIIASFCSLLGISFFALPAGILGSGFALKVQQQQRQKHMIRRRQPAAMLIQSLWRCYAADEKSMSVATWKIHQVPYSPPSRASSSFRHNASFVGRLSTIRRHRQTASPSLMQNKSSETVGSGNGTTRINISEDSSSIGPAETRIDIEGDEDEGTGEPRVVLLTPQHKAAIRAIRKLKYFVARRKFREALKPYDVKDVIEQYSSGHADLLNRVKNLQFRLDQILGKQGSKNKDVYASKICLASRVVKVERQVDEVYTTLEKFFELYMEDRKFFMSVSSQQEQQGESSGEFFKACGLGTTTSTPSSMPHVFTNHAAAMSAAGAAGSSGICLKPKSILVDKQLSEPNSPITKSFTPPTITTTTTTRRPMQRGYSDLGNRIKKKVTLSCAACSHLPEPQQEGGSFNGNITLVVPQPGPSTSVSDDERRYEMTSSSSASTSGAAVVPSSPRTATESTSDEEATEELKEVEAEEDLEEEEEINETSLLCPAKQSAEIIITPSTLNTSVPENIGVEDIYLKNFKSNRRKYKDV